MIVIQEKAEERMAGLLREGRGKGRRCVHIRALGPAEAAGLAAALQEFPDAQDGYLLLCRDGDAFLLADRFPRRQFAALRRTIPKVRALYDADKDFGALAAIAEEKRAALAAAARLQAEAEAAARRERRRMEILADAGDAALVATLQDRRAARENPSILIVEDDAFIRSLLAVALPPAYAVSTARDGAGAIAAYLRDAPDVVFLDIGLPDISGHDVLRKIMELDPHARVVMLSAMGSHENVMNAVGAGARGFVGKPFTRMKLLQYLDVCGRAGGAA